MISPSVFRLFFLAGFLVLPLEAESNPIIGYWQNIADEGHFVGCEEGSFLQYTSEKEFRQFVVREYSDTAINLPNLGPALPGGKTILYRMDGEELSLQRHGFLENDTLSRSGFHVFRRLAEKPSQLTLRPLKEGQAQLSPEMVEEISTELLARMQRDQAARRREYTQKDQLAQSEDHRWLREKVSQVGWIDLERFSPRVVQAAFLIAQHSIDMRLRLVAQKGLEADCQRGFRAEGMLSILADRNFLYVRGIQKYGTHFYRTKDQRLVFLPFDERSQIESRRRSLKMSTFKDYLDQLRQSFPDHQIEVLDTVRAQKSSTSEGSP